MSVARDLFGPGSNKSRRIITDHDSLKETVASCRKLGWRVGLIQGTYDLLHEGHVRYLEKGKEQCDVLIVGVDSDAKVKKAKGPNRPFVSEDARMEMLCHVRHVDLVFLKGVDDVKWQLIKTVVPDVLIATEETYTAEEREQIKDLCKELVILMPQAATSTTARIRTLLMEANGKLLKEFEEFAHKFTELIKNLGAKGG